jgi:hypothetical protein
MADWELIDHNPYNGLKKYLGTNPDDPDGVLVRYEQDADSIDAVLDQNKSSQADGWDKRSDMWHAARIPIGVMFEWKKRFNVDAWKYASCGETRTRINRLLNDPEWRYLRVNHFIMDTRGL